VELNTQWEQASGDMNDIFAVTRQGASDAVKLLSESAVEGQYPDRLAPLKTMAQDKQVPDRAALALLPATLLQEIRESGRVAQFNGKVLDAQGRCQRADVDRIGSFALLGDAGFLQPGAEGLSPVLGLPGSVLSAGRLSGSGGRSVAAGSLHGVLLDMLAQPHLLAASPAGRPVGAIIALLAAIGLGIAGYGCGASPASWVGFVASSRAVNITPTTPSAGC
jgi:hypothetical protein